MTETDIQCLNRQELIEYLEAWGYQCYDYESTADLRQAALDNHQCEFG